MATVIWNQEEASSNFDANWAAMAAQRYAATELRTATGDPTGNVRFFGRMMFPHLFEPHKMEGAQGKPSYSTMVAFIPGYDLTLLANMLKAKQAEKWPKGAPAHHKVALRKQDEKFDESGQSRLAGMQRGGYFTTVSSTAFDKNNNPLPGPKLVRMVDKQIITDRTEIYPGCWGLFVCNPYNFDAPANCGTKFGLQMFIKVFDDKPLGGGGRVTTDQALQDLDIGDFDAAEGGANVASTVDDLMGV